MVRLKLDKVVMLFVKILLMLCREVSVFVGVFMGCGSVVLVGVVFFYFFKVKFMFLFMNWSV